MQKSLYNGKNLQNNKIICYLLAKKASEVTFVNRKKTGFHFSLPMGPDSHSKNWVPVKTTALKRLPDRINATGCIID